MARGRQWLNHAGGFLNGLHLTFLRLTTAASNMIIGIAAARLVGAEAFGKYVSLYAIAGLIATLASLGLATVLARELAASRGDGNRWALRPTLQIYLAIQAFLITLAIGFNISGCTSVTAILLFVLANNFLSLIMHLFDGHEKVLLSNWIGGVLRPLFSLLVIYLFSRSLTLSAPSIVIAQSVGALLAAITLLLFWRGENLLKAFTRIFTRTPSNQHRQVFVMGITFSGIQILIGLMTQADILLLTFLADPVEVGYYFAATRAALAVSFFFGSYAKLAEPKITRLHASGEKEKAQQLVTSTAISGFVMTLITAIGACILAPFYLDLYGEGFQVAFPALVVIMCGLIGQSFFGPAQSTLRAIRQERKLLGWTAIALILGMIISALLIFPMGILGVAIGTAFQFIGFGMFVSSSVKSNSSLHTSVLGKNRTSP